MWFRNLTASAACAALLGLAAAGLVRKHSSEVMSALEPKTSSSSPIDEPSQTDGCSLSVIDLAPEGVKPEPRPTSMLLQRDAKGHLAATARLAFSHKPVRDTFAQELDRGIRKFAERRYEIKRSTLELALRNLGLVARLVHVMPAARDGKPFGCRLFAIKADGPIAKLGLRNDDVLVSMNGLDIATPDHVLDAYSKLQTASHLVLELVRERREMIQEYLVR